jgi:hypothetical protein
MHIAPKQHIHMTAMPPLSRQARHELCLIRRDTAAHRSFARSPMHPWLDLLQRLTGLDQTWIETQTSGVNLVQRSVLHGIRTRRNIGSVEGRRFALTMLFDAWFRVREMVPTGDFDTYQLAVEDRQGARLLTLWSDAVQGGCLLRSTFRAFRSGDGGSLVRGSDPLSCVCWPVIIPFAERSAPGSPGADLVELAEVCRWTRLAPERLGDHCAFSRVRTDRVPDFLEALVHQALPVRLSTGTAGVAQRCDVAFKSCFGRDTGRLQLLGDDARLRLETAAIGTAWIYAPVGTSSSRRQLRLYDDAGRALLFIEDLPGFRDAENPMWRTLLNTLPD